MTSAASGRTQDPHADTGRARGSLALFLQEALTATVRLRANRQVAADAESFRTHLRNLMAVADEEARRAGYTTGDIKRAIYAVTVFVDESVLNSSQPMFADWPRKPLQEELFGGHMGGEVFFNNLREMLSRQDSEDLADLLEVHQLCLLLGFKGRYSQSDSGELRGLVSAVADKIQRIRGGFGPLAPSWGLPSGEQIPVARDPWLRRLLIVAGGTCGFALLLFLVFRLALGSGVDDLHSLARQLFQ